MALSAGCPADSLAQSSRAEGERIRNALNEAATLRKEKKHDQAIALLEETLARVRRSAKPREAVVGGVGSHLGMAYYEAGQFAKAEPILREAVEIGRAQSGPAGDFRYPAMRALAATLLKLERFDAAVATAEEARKEIEARYGEDDAQANMARDELALAYYLNKRPKDAIPLSRTCLKYAEARYSADGPETIHYRNNLATSLLSAGEYLEAKALFERSLAIARARLGHDHPDAVNSLKGLNAANISLDRTADSVDRAREVLAAVEARPDVPPLELVSTLNLLAVAYQKAGRYAEAKDVYLRALEMARRKLGPSDPTTASILANFAMTLHSAAQFAEAERYLRQALEITAVKPGRDSDTYATQLSNLAAILVTSGRRAQAAPLIEEALKIMVARHGEGDPTVSALRHNLATLRWALKDYKAAVEEDEAALAELRRSTGGDSHSTAIILINLGQSYLSLRNYEKAEARLKRALEILEADRSTPRDEMVKARHAVAELYLETNRLDLAEAISRTNVAEAMAHLGPGHPDTGNVIDDLAMVYYAQGRKAEALETMDGARKARREFLLRVLPGLAESDQFALVAEGERISRDVSLLLAVQRRAEPGVAARSAEWVANSKALTVRALASAAVLARDAGNPEAIRIRDELNATRGHLARLGLARDADGGRPAAEGEDYKAVAERELELSRQLGLMLGDPVVAPWTTLAELRASLPADAVLVDFAKVFVTESEYRFEGLTGPAIARYAAWVIPPAGRGEVALIDLGFAESLEQAIADARAAIQPPPGRRIEADDERRCLAALQVLSDRLYGPLAEHLGPARRWVLGLDASLWLVPWAALPVGDGRYAVEEHLIHHVVSGRDLVARVGSSPATAPAIVADPDYDLAVGLAAARARELGHGPAGTPGVSRGPGRHRSEAIGGAFARLPATADEAREIAPLLKAITGSAPDVFLQSAASETVFKSLRSPRMLILSTHGFFLDGPEPDSSEKSSDSASSRRSLPANPLLRSGLILAGYNQAISSGDGDDDGLITGLEVAGCDFRGTDLVVLSACETGLGKIRAGEGVAGLRQVFQLAGAKSVIASIWKVPDVESYQLMSALFRGLSHGRGNAEALREAQLALIADQRARRGTAHPYYWAAFSLTGFPGPSWREEALLGIGSADLTLLPQPRPEATGRDRAISPITGLPEVSNPWSDSVLVVVLLATAAWAGRRWWVLRKP